MKNERAREGNLATRALQNPLLRSLLNSPHKILILRSLPKYVGSGALSGLVPDYAWGCSCSLSQIHEAHVVSGPKPASSGPKTRGTGQLRAEIPVNRRDHMLPGWSRPDRMILYQSARARDHVT